MNEITKLVIQQITDNKNLAESLCQLYSQAGIMPENIPVELLRTATGRHLISADSYLQTRILIAALTEVEWNKVWANFLGGGLDDYTNKNTTGIN